MNITAAMIVIGVADFGDSTKSKIYHDDTQYAVTSTVHLYLESSIHATRDALYHTY